MQSWWAEETHWPQTFERTWNNLYQENAIMLFPCRAVLQTQQDTSQLVQWIQKHYAFEMQIIWKRDISWERQPRSESHMKESSPRIPQIEKHWVQKYSQGHPNSLWLLIPSQSFHIPPVVPSVCTFLLFAGVYFWMLIRALVKVIITWAPQGPLSRTRDRNKLLNEI